MFSVLELELGRGDVGADGVLLLGPEAGRP